MEEKDTIPALSALAHESRLAVFRLLVGAGPEGLPAGVIGERLGIAPTTLSFHLAQLSHAGLIGARRDGRSIIYATDFGVMRELVAFLTENCCGGRPEDCDLPRAAASTRQRAPTPGGAT